MAHFPALGESLWNHTVERIAYPELRHDLEVDVAVIGAGITGLTAAYMLKKRGKNVAVFEKYRIGDSISGHTTAKVTAQHGIIYHELTKKVGEEAAGEYAKANLAAVDTMENIIAAEQIDCDWRSEDSYVFTDAEEETARLRDEEAAARRLGLPVSLLDTIALPIPCKKALRFQNQATFHIVKYLYGLARAVEGGGSLVFEMTKVTNVSDGEMVTFSTPNGRVSARQVILATNIPSPLKDHAYYSLKVYPTRSYLIAGRIDQAYPGMYISAERPIRSILPTQIGEENWLIIGGDGHMVGLGGPSAHHYRELEEYAREHFGLKDVRYRWSAWDYVSYDKLPVVGKLYATSQHLYTATGFRKWGMTNATVAATVLADAITGERHACAELFDPSRASLLRSIPKGLARGIKPRS